MSLRQGDEVGWVTGRRQPAPCWDGSRRGAAGVLEGNERSRLRRLWPEIAAFIVLTMAIWLPRGLALDAFISADEPGWLQVSTRFYDALRQGDLPRTYQRDHPGVTTLWAGTAGILWQLAAHGSTGVGEAQAGVYDRVVQEQSAGPREILAAGRFFAVLSHTVVLMLVYILARRLFGPVAALVGVLFIALDPFYTAHSRFLHQDGFLSSFVFLSLLAFLCYLRERRFLYLLLSGIAAGLSWLTKVPGFFLVPVVGLVALLNFLRQLQTWRGAGLASLVWQSVWPLAVWSFLGAAVFFVLWPAMWVDPIGTLSKVLTASVLYAKQGHEQPVFFDGMIFADGKVGLSYWYFYPITYLWRTTPVVLIGLAAAAAAFVWKREPLAEATPRRAVIGLMLFVLLFTIVMTLGNKKFDRYLLPVYIPLDLIAALGWIAIVKWLSIASFPVLNKFAVPVVLGAILLVQALGVVQTFPYYLSYYNPLMGGSKKAPEVMMIGWGEGLDKAAEYLNGKPNAKNLVVASWYPGCFSSFFSGKTRMIGKHTELSEDKLKRVLASDYAVIYVHQWQRGMPQDLLDLLAPLAPEKTIWIDGLEYVRIYKMSDVVTSQ